MSGNKKVTVRMLTGQDYLTIRQCTENNDDFYTSNIFVAPAPDYIMKIISGYGYTAGAFLNSIFIGFASVVFPKGGKHNIGHLLRFDDEQMLAVAQIEHVYVVPEYRTKGTATQLLNYLLSKIDSKYTIILSTVAPQNTPSLSLAFRIGQRVVSHSIVYGGDRFIMLGIRSLQRMSPDLGGTSDTLVFRTELQMIDMLLESGYEAISFGVDKSSLRFTSRW